ncbi:ABC transporter ATP-binding protein [Mesoaciditoga lauensis]|uniref:ABC transporter ATP-binding protein n=1 Tax=Mesoaciditoga lauensis TaxID=1495039 RepID=UPI00056B80A7|nr:oligopeptide/dipeptide ABC transporter ATP-binding protein [Mesoaciditoga lauensis]
MKSDVALDLLLKVKSLKKYFPLSRGPFRKPLQVKAVDDVSFEIPQKSIFAVVGESGSGKTTLARTVLRLIEPTAGQIFYKDEDLTKLDPKQLRKFRRKMQIISQDPYNSLHPRKLVKDIVGEGLKIHFHMSSNEILDKVKETLERVGLREEHMFRYPHEFSGGQRQRIATARAIVLKPEFLVLDEPTSALDVSVQAIILKMLKDLKSSLGLTYLFITHDLAVVDYMADYVAVMYLGQIVEMGTKEEIFNHTSHPYTYLLMNSIPNPDPHLRKEKMIPKGEIPSSVNPPSGCRFHTRCPYAKKICEEKDPPFTQISETHFVKCHFPLS